MFWLSSLVLSLCASLTLGQSSNSTSTPAINITGNAFFNSETGERFYIRGVDYQPGGSSNLTDPLADVEICKRDIPVFQDLGINTIRVYTVDNSLDHSECMQMLQDAGIYLILDVNTPEASISRYNPSCSYNAVYLQSIFSTVDDFAQYDNVLGFFAGNEVINMANNTYTATYVKAVVRDLKKYIKARDYRAIPVGYSAADIESNRELAAQYFNCGDDEDARIDMFGVNDYSWCGQSSFQTSGYNEKMKIYEGYSLPIFLSEFGCNQVASSRPFTEIGSLYSTQMSSVFSGGLVYEYSNETNNYGLVQIVSDTEVTKLQDFDNLKEQYSKQENPSGNGGASTTKKVFGRQTQLYQKCQVPHPFTFPVVPVLLKVLVTIPSHNATLMILTTTALALLRPLLPIRLPIHPLPLPLRLQMRRSPALRQQRRHLLLHRHRRHLLLRPKTVLSLWKSQECSKLSLNYSL
mgnify:CR=1 FL=1